MGKLEGEVTSGMEKAQEFLSMDEYIERIEPVTGFRPYPGTLNLKVDPEKIAELKDEVEKYRIDGFKADGNDFGGIDIYMVELEGIKGAVLDIDMSDREDDVAEIIAEDRLRDRLDLEDGDRVELEW